MANQWPVYRLADQWPVYRLGDQWPVYRLGDQWPVFRLANQWPVYMIMSGLLSVGTDKIAQSLLACQDMRDLSILIFNYREISLLLFAMLIRDNLMKKNPYKKAFSNSHVDVLLTVVYE